MNSSEIFQIKQDYQGVANQIFQMLIAWQQKQGTQQGPARQSLLDALRTVQRNDLAEKLGQMQAGAQGDVADSASGGISITAAFSNPPQPHVHPQPQPQAQPHPSQQQQQQQQPKTQTVTYHAPPGTVPYVGHLTITGKQSPVIIGSVSNSTFNFGCRGGSGDKK
jgi:hypothetical protein